jgi:DNA-binding winged helix-turn-helix (wHTH) protein
MAMVLRFDVFELDARTLELRRRGVPVALRPQPARLLAYMAERPGVLVTREELRAALWPAGTFVRFDEGLNSCMRQVRAALGDRPERPRFIETLPRRGYRFLMPVSKSIASVGGVRRPHLVVLPFEAIDLTDTAPPLVTEEFEEALIARLAALRPERVAVPAGQGKAGRDAGDSAADYVVTGSIRRLEGQVHVTVRLIGVRDRTPVWAETFEHPLVQPLLWLDETVATIADGIIRALGVGPDTT